MVRHLITQHDRHVLEALSTLATTDPVVMRAFRLLERLDLPSVRRSTTST